MFERIKNILTNTNTGNIAIIFGIAVLLVVIVIILLISILFRTESTKTNQNIYPTPASINEPWKKYPFTPLQKTSVGLTTDAYIKKKYKVINEELMTDGSIKYKVESVTPTKYDEIRTKNGVVIFEKTRVFTIKFGDLKLLSYYENIFGKPQDIQDNIKLYGWNTSAYIFAGKGFTLIVNRFTNEVYEVQRYTPVSVQEYKTTYAEFLEPEARPGDPEYNH